MMKYLSYPDNWRSLARDIKAANCYVCQSCNKRCRQPGEMYLGWEYELTVAHYDQCYSDPEIFVACLCLPCHLRHDAPFSGLARRRHARIRGLLAGQLVLL